jgi:hypothetical protein
MGTQVVVWQILEALGMVLRVHVAHMCAYMCVYARVRTCARVHAAGSLLCAYPAGMRHQVCGREGVQQCCCCCSTACLDTNSEPPREAHRAFGVRAVCVCDLQEEVLRAMLYGTEWWCCIQVHEQQGARLMATGMAEAPEQVLCCFSCFWQDEWQHC